MPVNDAQTLFMDWLEQHKASVVQVAKAYTIGNEERQDLAQEILLQAWRSIPKFEGKANPSTWFYRVALHTAMNWRRNDEKRRTHQQPILEINTVPSTSADPHRQVVQTETLERLYQAIHQLPKSDVALVLLYLNELTYREMADVLGISESNVGVRLNRAKKALLARMNGESTEVQHDEP